MKPAYREKKVEAQTPLHGTLQYELFIGAPHQEIIELTEVVEEETPVGKEGASATRKPARPPDGTLEYELYVGAPHQEIIELTEVVEEETLVGKEGASATRKPARPPEGFEPVREKPGPERRTPGTRSGPRPTVIAPTASAKGETGPGRERRPEAKANKDEAVPISTEDRKLESGDQGTGDPEADQIFAEFFSSLDAGDLSEKMTGAGGSLHRPAWKKPPRNEDDDFKELLEELESAERAAAEETSESHSLAEEPVAAAGLQKTDWGWSDTSEPQCILTLEREIIRHQEEMERKISELRAQKEKLKRRYEDIRSLLYVSEDQLKPAVMKVFRTHWKLKVSDLENRKTLGFNDDILVEHDGRTVIFKIKSTSAARPSIKYITQIWQELHHSGLGERVEGGLILNHDITTDPRDRSPAYTGEDEEYLQDIIFLETRVLYQLTLAIVDYSLPLQEAKELLLRKGRGKFHLNEVAG